MIFSKIFKLLTILSLILPLVSCKDSKDEPKDDGNDLKSILVYMVATNTLNGYDNMDIQEMLIAANEIDLSKNNILIYHCSKNSNPKLKQIVIKNGVAQEIIIKEYSDQYSSLDKTRVSEVINDLHTLKPAEEYGLILWSHAMSWTPSKILSDNTVVPSYFGDDYGKHMNIDDLAEAIPDGMFSYIWMDCCYMASIECAYQLRNKCKWYIGYPTEILSNGMPYNLTLPHLTQETCDIVGAAKATFDYFNNGNSQSRHCTISVIDMSNMNNLAESTKSVLTKFEPISTSGIQKYSRGSQGPYYDFMQYVTTIANQTSTSQYIDNFINELNKTVIYKDCTDHFINITIDKSKFSGISTHAVNYDNSQNEDYYFTLDWYKDIYPQDINQ